MITIDFETVDYGIQQGLGPGAPWGDVQIIGMGYKIDEEKTEYTRDQEQMKQLLTDHNIWVAHNAQYEAGLAKMLIGDITKKNIYCTKLLSKLYNTEAFFVHSLEELAQKYLNTGKLSDTLLECAIELGLIKPNKGYYGNPELKAYSAALSKAKKQVWPILDTLDAATDMVDIYCRRDVDLTYDLFVFFKGKTYDWDLATKYCRLINVTTDMRAKGVKVDLARVAATKRAWVPKIIKAEAKFWEVAQGTVNWRSPKELKTFLEERGYEPVTLPGELEGGYGKAFLKAHEGDPLVDAISECRRWSKAVAFCDSVFKYEKNGRVYPEMNILEARTGRFSCRNPNIQQIPKRDKEIGPAMRAIFIPEEGQQWVSGDFSNQEGRLVVHFAQHLHQHQAKYFPSSYNRHAKKHVRDKESVVFDCQVVADLAEAYAADPKLDMHLFNLKLIEKELGSNIHSDRDVARNITKGINLGLMYGMGIAKLAHMLQVTETEAKALKAAFNKGSPYANMLTDYVQWTMEKQGYVTTIGGRRVYCEKGFEYKALNKLIQGSAADQTSFAMVDLYDKGVDLSCCVHDEINISCDINTGNDIVMKETMEGIVKLNVPSFTDLEYGQDWSLGKYKEIV